MILNCVSAIVELSFGTFRTHKISARIFVRQSCGIRTCLYKTMERMGDSINHRLKSLHRKPDGQLRKFSLPCDHTSSSWPKMSHKKHSLNQDHRAFQDILKLGEEDMVMSNTRTCSPVPSDLYPQTPEHCTNLITQGGKPFNPSTVSFTTSEPVNSIHKMEGLHRHKRKSIATPNEFARLGMIRKTLRSQSVVTTSVQDEKSRQLKRQSFDSGSTSKGVVAGIAALGNLMTMTCHVQGLKASELLCYTGQPSPSTSKVSLRTESDKNRQQRRIVSCGKISEVSTMHVGRHMSVPHVTPLTSPAVSVSSHNPSRRLTLPTGNFTHKKPLP